MAFQSTSISSRQNNSLLAHSLWLLISVNLLVGCGGGEEGGSGAILQGQFIDSPVYGLAYFSGNQSGKTDSNGRFNYQEGTDVTFMIGDIVIGKGPGAPIMTPVSLVPGAVDETHPVVLNIARFLQTLDTDQVAANGITISPMMHQYGENLTLDFELSALNFEGESIVVIQDLTQNPNIQILADSFLAESHLKSTLLSFFIGMYSGQLEGSFSGEWQIVVDSQGAISGSLANSYNYNFNLLGMLSSNGELYINTIGIAELPNYWLDFNGSVDRNGVMTGHWRVRNSLTNESGSFSGQRSSP